MQQILSKITVFLAFLVFFSGFFAGNSYSEENSKYLIEDIYVTVEGDSPANAKDLGFLSARKKAFSTLLLRLGYDLGFMEKINNSEISNLVRFEQVFDEKFFGNKYSANFKIYFAKDFVDDLFFKKNYANQSLENSENLNFLVIPVKMTPTKNLLWEDENNFKKFTENAVENKRIKNFNIVETDIENLAMLSSENVTRLDFKELEHFFEKYKVDVIYVAFFSYDENIEKASVLVRGFERLRKFQYRLGFINSNKLSDEDLTQKVSEKMVDYLSKLKIEEIRAQGVEKDMVRIEIPVRNLGQWLTIKEKIEKSGFVTKLDIESVSRDYVRISVLSENSLNIVNYFAKIGFTLTSRSQNIYLLTY